MERGELHTYAMYFDRFAELLESVGAESAEVLFDGFCGNGNLHIVGFFEEQQLVSAIAGQWSQEAEFHYEPPECTLEDGGRSEVILDLARWVLSDATPGWAEEAGSHGEVMLYRDRATVTFIERPEDGSDNDVEENFEVLHPRLREGARGELG